MEKLASRGYKRTAESEKPAMRKLADVESTLRTALDELVQIAAEAIDPAIAEAVDHVSAALSRIQSAAEEGQNETSAHPSLRSRKKSDWVDE